MILNGLAAENRFNAETLSAPSAAGTIYRIACPRMQGLASMDIQVPGGMLAALIEAANRGATSIATIVLDEFDCNSVPLCVDFAVEHLLQRQVRTGVIVVCDGAMRHDGDTPLPRPCASTWAQPIARVRCGIRCASARRPPDWVAVMERWIWLELALMNRAISYREAGS